MSGKRRCIYRAYGYKPPKPKKLKIPDIKHDVEELLRLMKRKRVEQEFESEEGYGCPICNDPIHLQSECPCNDKIPPGTVISSAFDEVCIGCGRIGEICCNKGAYAVLRRCPPCHGIGHWYWDNKCTPPSYVVKLPSIQELEDRVKNNDVKDEDEDWYTVVDYDDDDDDDKEEVEEEEEYQYGRRDRKKLKMPNIPDDAEELLRLMKRKPVEQKFESEEGYGCPICNDPIHLQSECPCNDKIPPGTAISSAFDEVCIGCGKIGEICCNKGAYAVLRYCPPCDGIGHWYWDNKCTPPPYKVKLPSIQELEDRVKNKEVPSTDQSLENSLQNKEDDEFMVDAVKDNKDKYVVVDKDADGKEDETKGGNESSYESRFIRWKEFLEHEDVEGSVGVGRTFKPSLDVILVKPTSLDVKSESGRSDIDNWTSITT